MATRPKRPADNVVSLSAGGKSTPPGDGEPGGLPCIVVDPGSPGGKYHEGCYQAEEVLRGSPLPVFQRDGKIVLVIGLDPTTPESHRPVGAPQIVPVERPHMRRILSSLAHFVKPRRTPRRRKSLPAHGDDDGAGEAAYVVVDPPLPLVDGVLANPLSTLPVLTGFTEAPTIDLTGKLLDKPGYIPELGLLLTSVPDGWESSRPKRAPIKIEERAQAAVKVLTDALSTFPFKTEADRSAALAMILTGLMRRVLPAAPIFGISSPTPGTGKSLLSDIVSIICTGRPAAVMSVGDDWAELEKRLGAVLIAGDALINLDNISIPLKSDLLCSIATQLWVLIRVLGVSKRTKVTTRSLIIVTGNNLVVRGDLIRRFVSINLDARCERPEVLRFKTDALKDAERNRARLIGAALQLVICYQNAGSPSGDVDPYGSFREWDEWVRRPLIWAGLADPLESGDGLRQADPDLEAHAAVLAAWLGAFGSRAVTAHEVVTAAANRELTQTGEPGRLVHPELAEALSIALGARSGSNSSKVLGYWARTHKDRPVSGLVLRQAGTKRNIKVWMVEDAQLS